MHGTGGGWKVAKQRLRWEVLEAVQEGAKEFGILPRKDFNDGNNEGSGFFEVNQHRGIRWTTAKGFLRPAMYRPNLRVELEAEVERLIFDGRNVAGLKFRKKGVGRRVHAQAEVLLAAGSINSPKILELSGVGQSDRLARLGIEVVHDSPGVGENLQDHQQIRTVFKVRNAQTLNTLAHGTWGKLRIVLEYALRRSGPLSMAPSQFGMFTKSDTALSTPDLEYHVQPLSTDRLGDPLHRFSAITVSVCNLRPESVGTCHVTAPDHRLHPEIRPNYLAAARDRIVAVKSVRQARMIMTAKALQRYAPEEFLPGPDVQSDAELLLKVGDIATTIFHPVGTCGMGCSSNSVVGADLRVHGLNRVRVVDASVMPRITSGNTASPVVMIAEKAADMIREGRAG